MTVMKIVRTQPSFNHVRPLKGLSVRGEVVKWWSHNQTSCRRVHRNAIWPFWRIEATTHLRALLLTLPFQLSWVSLPWQNLLGVTFGFNFWVFKVTHMAQRVIFLLAEPFYGIVPSKPNNRRSESSRYFPSVPCIIDSEHALPSTVNDILTPSLPGFWQSWKHVGYGETRNWLLLRATRIHFDRPEWDPSESCEPSDFLLGRRT